MFLKSSTFYLYEDDHKSINLGKKHIQDIALV